LLVHVMARNHWGVDDIPILSGRRGYGAEPPAAIASSLYTTQAGRQHPHARRPAIGCAPGFCIHVRARRLAAP